MSILIQKHGDFLVAHNATRAQSDWLKDLGWWYHGPYSNARNAPKLRQLGITDHCRYLPLANAATALTAIEDPQVEMSAEVADLLNPLRVNLSVSRAHDTTSDLNIPSPEGLSYRAYQVGGVSMIVDNYRKNLPGTLIGDEMGLGKTMQAIGAFAILAPKRVLVLCLASIRANWVREITKWLPGANVQAADSVSALGAQYTVISYTSLVGSGDRASKLRQVLLSQNFDMIVCDEAHVLKNETSKTSQTVLGTYKRGTLDKKGIIHQGAHTVILTGTPIQNKVRESLPLFRAVGLVGQNAPLGADGQFLFRYCGARKESVGYRTFTTFNGATNLPELQAKLRSSGRFMRRLKAEVATELPPKVRTVIVQDNPNEEDPCANLIPQAWSAVDTLDFKTASFQEISAYRAALAVHKSPMVVEYVQGALESLDGGKVIVFAHHQTMLDALEQAFPTSSIRIDGSTPVDARLPLVDRFQNDPGVQVAILSTRAAGTGLTLTAASLVIFGEADWNPAQCVQAEDRAHRIGQEADCVNVQYLVIEGTLDARVITVMARKMDIADRALDRKAAPVEACPAAPAHEATPAAPAATSTARSVTIRQRGQGNVTVTLTDAQIEAIGAALCHLSGMCDGARQKDDVGFNGQHAHSDFVRSLVVTARAGRLSLKQAAWAYSAILPTYRRTQIAHLAPTIWP